MGFNGTVATILAGSGSLVGAIAAALITVRSSKGKSRAEAANIIVGTYSGYADRITADNKRLDKDNTRLRQALVALIKAEQDHADDRGIIDKAVNEAERAVLETSL